MMALIHSLWPLFFLLGLYVVGVLLVKYIIGRFMGVK